jgi:TPP-dependent 2-oxoacid decarboxylase
MNTAQVLVELLKEYRVEHIFGVPGDTTMGLLWLDQDVATVILRQTLSRRRFHRQNGCCWHC